MCLSLYEPDQHWRRERGLFFSLLSKVWSDTASVASLQLVVISGPHDVIPPLCVWEGSVHAPTNCLYALCLKLQSNFTGTCFCLWTELSISLLITYFHTVFYGFHSLFHTSLFYLCCACWLFSLLLCKTFHWAVQKLWKLTNNWENVEISVYRWTLMRQFVWWPGQSSGEDGKNEAAYLLRWFTGGGVRLASSLWEHNACFSWYRWPFSRPRCVFFPPGALQLCLLWMACLIIYREGKGSSWSNKHVTGLYFVFH